MKTPDYIVLDWCGEGYEVLVHGHVDAETLRAALVAENHDAEAANDGVRHIYGRWDPRPERHDCDRYLVMCDGPARGAARFTMRAGAR